MSLEVAPGLVLPDDVATRRQAILATSGAGKSNAAVVMAEQMFHAGIPWVAIDPKGDWYGVRSSADGTGPGLAVPVFGGEHGDLPLDPTNGKLLARLIAERRLTCVLDVSEFDSRQDQWRFLHEFADELLKRNRSPLHLFLEEADEYLPQTKIESGWLPKCVGSWARLVRRGRNHGIGSTLITQRSAVVSKDVLYLAEALYAMRISAKKDRDLVRGWAVDHDAASELVDSLPQLSDGEAWVISPGWLKRTDRVQFPRRSTFDSGSTPVFGEDAPRASLADVDIEALTVELASTIERVAADDPEKLRAQIVHLKNELAGNARLLADAKAALDSQPPAEVEVEVPTFPGAGLTDAAREAAEGALRLYDESLDSLRGLREALSFALAQLEQEASLRAADAAASSARRTPPRAPTPGPEAPSRGRRAPSPPPFVPPISPDDVIVDATTSPMTTQGDQIRALGDGAAAKVLAALARHQDGLYRRQLPSIAGVKARTSTLRNALSKLRRAGLLLEDGDRLTLSPAGFDAARHVEGLPTGPALLDHWRGEIGGGAAGQTFEFLLARYPRGATRDEIAATLGINRETSTLRNALSKLRIRGLIEVGGDEIVLARDLMDSAA